MYSRRSKLTLIPHISRLHSAICPSRPSCFSFSSSFFSRAALRVTSAKPWNCEKASAHLLYITCSWVTASQYLTGQQDFKNPKASFLSWISNKSIHISKVSTPEVNHGQICQKLTVVFKYSIKYGICSTMSWCKLYDFQDQMQQTTSMPFLKMIVWKQGWAWLATGGQATKESKPVHYCSPCSCIWLAHAWAYAWVIMQEDESLMPQSMTRSR